MVKVRHRVRVRVRLGIGDMFPLRPITVRPAVPFRKLSYSCKSGTRRSRSVPPFRSGNYNNPALHSGFYYS